MSSDRFTAKLDDEQVAQIREFLKERVSVSELARRFNVSRGVIGDIKTGVYRTASERSKEE